MAGTQEVVLDGRYSGSRTGWPVLRKSYETLVRVKKYEVGATVVGVIHIQYKCNALFNVTFYQQIALAVLHVVIYLHDTQQIPDYVVK